MKMLKLTREHIILNKLLFFLLIVFGVNKATFAQIERDNKINGYINNSGEEPIPNVRIYIPGTTEETFSELDGYFEFVVGDNEVFKVELDGYESQTFYFFY